MSSTHPFNQDTAPKSWPDFEKIFNDLMSEELRRSSISNRVFGRAKNDGARFADCQGCVSESFSIADQKYLAATGNDAIEKFESMMKGTGKLKRKRKVKARPQRKKSPRSNCELGGFWIEAIDRLRGWIEQTARFRLQNLLRKKCRSDTSLDVDEQDFPNEQFKDVIDSIIDEEEANDLQLAVDALDDVESEIVTEVKSGYTLREIAAKTGKTVSQVRSVLRSALVKLEILPNHKVTRKRHLVKKRKDC